MKNFEVQFLQISPYYNTQQILVFGIPGPVLHLP